MRSKACLLLEVLKAKNLSIRGSDVTSMLQSNIGPEKNVLCGFVCDKIIIQNYAKWVFGNIWKYIVFDPTRVWKQKTGSILIPAPALLLAPVSHGTGTVRSTLLLGHHHVLIVFLRATLPTMVVPKCAKFCCIGSFLHWCSLILARHSQMNQVGQMYIYS